MKSFDQIIDEQKLKNKKLLDTEYKLHRPFIKIGKDDFWRLFCLQAQQILIQRRLTDNVFKIIDSQTDLIEQLFFYFTGDDKFKGDFNSGIWLWGPHGCGKSLILYAYIKCFHVFGKSIEYQQSKEFALSLNSVEAIKAYSKKPLFLDDLLRETSETSDYRATIRPIGDLFLSRCDYGGWTFATCNWARESPEIKKKYGSAVLDRMNVIFNQFELKGSSQRKIK